MRFCLVIIITFLSVSSLAQTAPTGSKRFDVVNEINGYTFTVFGDALPSTMPPEWGLPSRELPCSDVPAVEASRITSRQSRETTPGDIVEFCTLKDQFKVTTTDRTAELAEKTRKEGVRSTRVARMIVLAKKLKAGTITAAERTEAQGLLLLEAIKNADDTVD